VSQSENRNAPPPADSKEVSYPYKAPPTNPSASVPSRDAKVRQATPIKLDINIKPSKT